MSPKTDIVDRREQLPEETEHLQRGSEIRRKARDIFMRYGFRKTTIEDIGRACGLGKAALYHYYSSKEELFAEVVRVECETVQAQIRAAVAAAGDPRAKLIAMAKTTFAEASTRIDELVEAKSTSDMSETMPLVAQAIRRFVDEEVKILQEILEMGERQGVFKKVDCPAVPLVINAGLRGVLFNLLETPTTLPLEEAMDTLLELFLDGLCRK